ncbi:MAG TPA: hypothetical protein PLT50_02165 [bacterium]|nr:hypothetical protein [bacterium]
MKKQKSARFHKVPDFTKIKKHLTIEELVKRVSGTYGNSGRVITNAEVLKLLKEYP